MVMNLPTLPPPLLERCLALSEHLCTMKSGSAKLEISPSHFLFSVDHPPGNKEAGNLSTTPPNPIKRKKTPSDLRRNAKRKKKFLEEKYLASSGTSSQTTSINTGKSPNPSPVNPPSNIEESPDPNPNIEELTSHQHEKLDLPETNMEVDAQIPMIPNNPANNVTETTENIDEETLPPADMDVTTPQPEFSLNREIKEVIDLSDAWPEDIIKILNDPKNSSSSLTVVTIVGNAKDYKSALGSLRKTLRKCNLRSIEPKKVENLAEGAFAFEFKLIRKNIKPTFMNIKNNWMDN